MERGAELFKHALQTIRPGVKEIEVAAEMEYAARKDGAEGMAFETIIASGARSALPDPANIEDGRINVEFPVASSNRGGRSELRGKMNGGGAPLTIKTGDGSINILK